MPMPMIPEIRKRIAKAVSGGASITIILADVKAEAHMKANITPIATARKSMILPDAASGPDYG